LSAFFFRKNYLLLLSLFLLACSYGIWVISTSRESDHRDSVKAISANIHEQIIIAKEEADLIRKIIEETGMPVFSALKQKTKFPYFIFRNQSIYFWSDNHFTPAYEVRFSEEWEISGL
jgi:hypothetical protein